MARIVKEPLVVFEERVPTVRLSPFKETADAGVVVLPEDEPEPDSEEEPEPDEELPEPDELPLEPDELPEPDEEEPLPEELPDSDDEPEPLSLEPELVFVL